MKCRTLLLSIILISASSSVLHAKDVVENVPGECLSMQPMILKIDWKKKTVIVQKGKIQSAATRTTCDVLPEFPVSNLMLEVVDSSSKKTIWKRLVYVQRQKFTHSPAKAIPMDLVTEFTTLVPVIKGQVRLLEPDSKKLEASGSL